MDSIPGGDNGRGRLGEPEVVESGRTRFLATMVCVAGLSASSVAVGVAALPGERDPRFGSDRRALHDLGIEDASRDVAIDRRGRTISAGISRSEGRRVIVARFRRDGALDRTFGRRGRATISSSPDSGNPWIASAPGGKTVVAYAERGAEAKLNVVRLNASGGLDRSFGRGGRVRVESAAIDELEIRALAGVAVQRSGAVRLAASGGRFVEGSSTRQGGLIAMALSPDGNVDLGFGEGGAGFIPFPDLGSGSARALTTLDGDVLVAGLFDPLEGGSEFIVGRFDDRGDPVTAFGDAGVASGRAPYAADSVRALGDGRIAVAGRGYGDFTVTVLRPGGTLDASFGDGGVAHTDFADGDDRALEVLEVGNGLVLAGQVPTRRRDLDFGFAAFTMSGSLDRDRFESGRLVVDSGNRERDLLFAAAAAGRGALVAGGATRPLTGREDDTMLVRVRGRR